MIKIGKSGNKEISFDLPTLIETRLLIQSASGGGKSYAIRRLLEQSHGQVQQIVLDLEGEFSSLREKFDYIIAGKDGDTPAHPSSANMLARRLLELKVSAICDLYELPKHDRIRFVRYFLESLVNAPRSLWQPVMVVLDEAHHFCMDSETEILSPEGWKRYDEIEKDFVVVAFNPATGTYANERISRVIIRDHEGEMVRLKSDGIDCVVTSDHRVVLRRIQRAKGRYGVYDWTFCSALNVPTHIHVPMGGAPEGRGISELSTQFAHILGLILTDGYYTGGSNKYLAICQSKKSIKCGERITDVLDKILLPHCVSKTTIHRNERKFPEGKTSPPGEYEEYYLGVDFSKQILNWLGNEIHRVPRAILSHGNKEQLWALYRGMLDGNGTSQKGQWVCFYPGQNEGQADDFQELATRLGISTSKTWVPSICQWHVRIAQRKHHYIRRPIKETYKGIVWDITVPSGAFVARRNGRVFVTGNCPEKGQVESYGAVIDLATRGRKRGFCAVLATQRLSKLHKDVCAELLNKMVGRTSLDIDQARAADELGIISKQDRIALRLLKPGEFHIYGPALRSDNQVETGVIKTMVGKVKSHHPKVGSRKLVAPPKPTSRIKKILSQIKDLPEEAKQQAQDIASLKKDNADLRRKLTIAEKQGVVKPCNHEEVIVKLSDQISVLEENNRLIKSERNSYKIIAVNADKGLATAIINHNKAGEQLSSLNDLISSAIAGAAEEVKNRPEVKPISRIKTPVSTAKPATIPRSVPTDNGDKEVRGGARRMLEVLAARNPMKTSKAQLATLSGLKKTSGTFGTYFSLLRTKKFISVNNGNIEIMEDGLEYIGGSLDNPMSPEEIQAMWRQKLSGGALRMFDHLLQIYPEEISREDLALEVGLIYGTGTWGTYLSALRSNDLINENGKMLKANETLFE